MNAATVTEAPAAIPLTVRPEVQRGADLLDEQLPGWDAKIDLWRLDLNYSCDCVVGQVFDDYHDGLRSLGLKQGQAVEDHGFELELDLNGDADYVKLTEEWRDLIASRR